MCRFIRKPTGCNVSLSISYEVPEVLAPFANVSCCFMICVYICWVHCTGVLAGLG